MLLESEPIAIPSKLSGASKANIFSLSKEISEFDQSVRSKMVVSNIEGVQKVGEQIWEEEGYFGKLNPDYSCHKNDFPENAPIYVNQAYLTVKDRDTMIYCDYTILAQIMPFKSLPENVDEAVKLDKKLVKIYLPIYDTTTGQFLGVKEGVGYIMVRNEVEETFLSYGFSSEHSSVLYCHSKQPIPNIFRGTSFNTHKFQTYLENTSKRSDLYFYLPTITDRKEDINRYKSMVSLVLVTSSVADIGTFSPEGYKFDPSHLDQAGKNRDCARETLYSYFQNVAKVFNANLIQNVYALIKKKKIDHSTLKWAPSMSQSKANYSKFSLDNS